MVKRLWFFIAFLTIGSISLAQPPVEDIAIDDTDSLEEVSDEPVIYEPQNLDVEGFDFEFKNYKNPENKKEKLKVGAITMSWKKKMGGNYFLQISEGDEEWSTILLDGEGAVEYKIDSVKENKFALVRFGQGDPDSPDALSTSFEINSLVEGLFDVTKAKGIIAGAELKWSIKRKIANHLLEDDNPYNDSVVVKYNTKTGAKYGSSDWQYAGPFHLDDSKLALEDLQGKQNYVWHVGISRKGPVSKAMKNDDQMIWSKKDKFETKRRWNWIKILILIGSLGFFIFGMKIMSEGIQKAAGSRMRRILGSMTSNRLKGIFTGFITTSLIQSSSATTVMVVSFVNAGLLKLKEAIGVIMGANIGTTITAWLIAYFGFKTDINEYAFVIIAIGFPMMFMRRNNIKSWGEFMVGFAILFMGLAALKGAVPDLKSDPTALEFLKDVSGTGVHHLLLAIFMGTILTVVVQSSSAAMAITITLCDAGFIPFEMAAGMVLGENIGTTITANLAALVGNVHAKRAARAHFIFNVFGVLWMILAFNFFIDGIDSYMSGTSDGSPIDNAEARPIGLSIFHTSFNILNVLLLVWFTPLIAKTVVRMVPSRGDADETFKLDYIETGLMGTPELSILEARKEVAKFGKITSKMNGFVSDLLDEKDRKKKSQLHSKIKKYEEITDRVEIEISDYLAKVTTGEMTQDTSERIRSMLSITNDLERIGDIFFQMSKSIERKENEKVWFTPEQRERLNSMFKLIDEAFEIMIENLNAEYGAISMDAAVQKEDEINRRRNDLKRYHYENIDKKDYNIKSGMVYNDLYLSLEKVGDHIINVSEAVAGQI